ncbi:unnamed protein product [Discula destructiva]
MLSYSSIIVALVACQSVLASPKPTTTATFLGTLPGDNKPPRAVATSCHTPVATTTSLFGPVCLLACLNPTSSCSAGEPTGPTPNPPRTSTYAPAGACTATVEVFNNAGCNNCPTCTSAPAVEARQTSFPGHQVCSPTSTVVTTIGAQTTAICACPLALTACSSGEPRVKPLPTTTLIEGCVESIVAGPGDCSNVCQRCA